MTRYNEDEDGEEWICFEHHQRQPCATCAALSDDANREMGLPEGEDWGDK